MAEPTQDKLASFKMLARKVYLSINDLKRKDGKFWIEVIKKACLFFFALTLLKVILKRFI